MRKSKFADRGEQSEEMALMITSMADIFTIILIFLLKTQLSGVTHLNMGQGLLLPEAHAETHYKDAIRVEIHPDAVVVDGRAVTPLRNFSFPSRNDEIYKALARQRGPGKPQTQVEDSRLLLLADEHTPYATLKTVMTQASAAGYVDLQLAVVQR